MSWTGGDWMCGACQHQNFKKRESCQRCGYPKYGGPDVTTYLYNRTDVLAGDWYCIAINCGAHNYASRTSCYRCGSVKNDIYANTAVYGSADSGSPPGWKSGDWICASIVDYRMDCGAHNFASRGECFKCRTPREYGS
ncbi:Zinc finger Ran-binding domain-containing protein 2 [Linum perenne]